jgi:hypothetical protein
MGEPTIPVTNLRELIEFWARLSARRKADSLIRSRLEGGERRAEGGYPGVVKLAVALNEIDIASITSTAIARH